MFRRVCSGVATGYLFEDEGFIVINKPAGFAVHGGSGVSSGIIEGLRLIRPEARFLELVHRLDKDTSGCLLIAKKRSACVNYKSFFRNSEIQRLTRHCYPGSGAEKN